MAGDSAAPDPAARRYEGRTAVVTGASRGIGLAIAERLIAEGARVCITARKPDALAEAVAGLNAGHAEPVALGIAGRADDADHQAEALGRTREAFGDISLLVNNTGINPAYGPLLDTPLDAARKTFDVNVLAVLGWVKLALAHGLAAPGGALVNVASVAGLRPAPGITLYGASKAALVSVTESLAPGTRTGGAGQRGGPGRGQDEVRDRALRGPRGRGVGGVPAAAGSATRPTSRPRWRSWVRRTRPG